MSNKYRVTKDEYDLPHHWDVNDKDGIWKGCFPGGGVMRVERIYSDDYKQWIMKKHYAHRMPSVSFAFGLFDDARELRGVCTIGKPASPSLCVGICGEKYSKYVYELNRLVVDDDMPKNTLSYFVGRTLKNLCLNLILVSYADTAMGHHGYIYQATNWIYTGATKERTDIGEEDGTHSRHYNKDCDYSINRKHRSSKHRYVYIRQTPRSKFKKKAMDALKYEILPYPKGENDRYDASYKPDVQLRFF